MKPYLLVAYNCIKFRWKRLVRCKGFQVAAVEMLSPNTRITLAPTSTVTFGDRLVSDGRTVVTACSGAKLTIGSRVYFNEDTMISCKEQITIGDGCRFGPNVKIFDNDHRFDAVNGVSAEHSTAPVSIGSRCWIGSNVVILRGTTIGDCCVIGAGCVVKGNIPAGSLVTQSRELVIRPIRET